MPIDSKAGNEQASAGKMQIKEVTMATSHRSPPPGTCHTVFSAESEPRGRLEGGGGLGGDRPKAKMTKLGSAKPCGKNCTAMAQLHIPTSAGLQQISWLSVIIDNLV